MRFRLYFALVVLYTSLPLVLVCGVVRVENCLNSNKNYMQNYITTSLFVVLQHWWLWSIGLVSVVVPQKTTQNYKTTQLRLIL